MGFNKEDTSQLKTCDEGQACLFYSYEKAESEFETIRECFSTSILLGSIERPVVPSETCRPQPVDADDSIQACICTTDFCSGIEDYNANSGQIQRSPQQTQNRNSIRKGTDKNSLPEKEKNNDNNLQTFPKSNKDESGGDRSTY